MCPTVPRIALILIATFLVIAQPAFSQQPYDTVTNAKLYSLESIVAAWNRYSDECWKDSSFSVGGWHLVWVGNSTKPVWSAGLAHQYELGWKREDRYIHRNPTFQDFIVWLQTKSKL